MRWRNRYLCVLGVVAAFTAVLACNGHLDVASGDPGYVYAPVAPRTAVQAVPVTHLLQSHFGGCNQIPARNNPSLALQAVLTNLELPRITGNTQPYYDPLYRRPPPSLS